MTVSVTLCPAGPTTSNTYSMNTHVHESSLAQYYYSMNIYVHENLLAETHTYLADMVRKVIA
jgi:hypothetical protein